MTTLTLDVTYTISTYIEVAMDGTGAKHTDTACGGHLTQLL